MSIYFVVTSHNFLLSNRCYIIFMYFFPIASHSWTNTYRRFSIDIVLRWSLRVIPHHCSSKFLVIWILSVSYFSWIYLFHYIFSPIKSALLFASWLKAYMICFSITHSSSSFSIQFMPYDARSSIHFLLLSYLLSIFQLIGWSFLVSLSNVWCCSPTHLTNSLLLFLCPLGSHADKASISSKLLVFHSWSLI